jgi:hypothetical protein
LLVVDGNLEIVGIPVAGLERTAQIRKIDAVAGQCLWIEQNPHRLVGGPPRC